MAMLCCVAARSTFALVVGKTAFRAQLARLEKKVEQRVETDAESDRARALLREVSMHARALRLETGEFPHSLGEALPDDPWGRPIEYRRLHAERAQVWSRGPDGVRATEDDVEIDIE
jgi:hypothetical protein